MRRVQPSIPRASIHNLQACRGSAPLQERHKRPYAAKETSPVPKMNFWDFFTRATRGLTSEHQRLTRLTLIIPINFPVVIIIALLLPERHRLVLVLL